VPVLLLVGLLAWRSRRCRPRAALALAVWQGVVPATFALVLGAALRRWLPAHPFVYVLGRGFLAPACRDAGTALTQQYAADCRVILCGHGG
jgi:hypothetical protein